MITLALIAVVIAGAAMAWQGYRALVEAEDRRFARERPYLGRPRAPLALPRHGWTGSPRRGLRRRGGA